MSFDVTDCAELVPHHLVFGAPDDETANANLARLVSEIQAMATAPLWREATWVFCDRCGTSVDTDLIHPVRYERPTSRTIPLPTTPMRTFNRHLNDRRVSVFGSVIIVRFLAWLHTSFLTLMSQSTRQTGRPWIAIVVVPILMVGCVLTLHLLLLIPLAALCWWWGSTSSDPWAWLLGILEAAWGVQWALLGLFGLVDYPRQRALVAVLWIGYAGLIAGIGAVNRWKYNRRYGW